jgi:hypothetical protein
MLNFMAPRLRKGYQIIWEANVQCETQNTPIELYYHLLSDTLTHHQSCHLAAKGILPIVDCSTLWNSFPNILRR